MSFGIICGLRSQKLGSVGVAGSDSERIRNFSAIKPTTFVVGEPLYFGGPPFVFCRFPKPFSRTPQSESECGHSNPRKCDPNIIRTASTAGVNNDTSVDPLPPLTTKVRAALAAPLLFLYLALVNCVGRRKKKDSK